MVHLLQLLSHLPDCCFEMLHHWQYSCWCLEYDNTFVFTRAMQTRGRTSKTLTYNQNIRSIDTPQSYSSSQSLRTYLPQAPIWILPHLLRILCSFSALFRRIPLSLHSVHTFICTRYMLLIHSVICSFGLSWHIFLQSWGIHFICMIQFLASVDLRHRIHWLEESNQNDIWHNFQLKLDRSCNWEEDMIGLKADNYRYTWYTFCQSCKLHNNKL
jgi:hypothetical protein